MKSDSGKWKHNKHKTTEEEIDLVEFSNIPSILQAEVEKAIDTQRIDKTSGPDVERGVTNGWKRYWSLKEAMKDKKLHIKIKIKLYNTCILPVLMYGCQPWKLTQEMTSKLATCQSAMGRSMLNVKKSDRPKNIIEKKTKTIDVTHEVRRLKWQWAGHMIRGQDKWNKKVTGRYPREGIRLWKWRVTALTWGHAARRLFVACGGAVATARVWRVVAPLQLLARVRAAETLPHPRAAADLPLPPRLQPLVANLFAHTIRCNVPEWHELRRFVSRPPPTPSRLHCTMLRHDDDEAGAYTLYLEHLGGLVPLLKGRRTSKIRPEFVIFDPQAEENSTPLGGGTRESSSSSTHSSNSSSSSSGGHVTLRPPRTPRAPRSPRRAPAPSIPTPPTDSSDSEQEEGCSGSPRLQRRRRARERRKIRSSSDKDDGSDDLAYIDSLPEDVRLVEVTSNIWGTKFKMHGLAKNVPANLGQVTYKTSLLHLQPRQMTLMITELRDDDPVGPDPTFNPNIFSEDEEEVFHTNDNKSSPSHINNNVRRKFGLSERVPRTNQNDVYGPNNNTPSAPSLARAESYDEFPYIDMSEALNNVPEVVYSAAGMRHAGPVERRVNSATAVSSRHAISPLRCDGSVPTLQSPKNAVAPTDIIFERPSPQTVTCGGRGDFCGGRTEYSVRGDNVTLKANMSNIDQQPFSLNLSVEPSRQVTIKKCDTHVTDNCLSKIRKNICNRGESSSYEMNTRILKSLCNKNYEHEIHPDAITKRADTLKNLQKNEDLKFIDEETSIETIVTNVTERPREGRVQRTTTVVPISPVCTSMPVYDTMTRSCSVGYLDLVDPAVLRAHAGVSALREQPRRLVLVHDRTRHHKKNTRRHAIRTHDTKTNLTNALEKSPNLKKCGKSKSLDSSELALNEKSNRRNIKQDPTSDTTDSQVTSSCSGSSNNNHSENDKKYLSISTTSKDKDGNTSRLENRRSQRDYPVCTSCRLVSPYDRRDVTPPRTCAWRAAPPTRSVRRRRRAAPRPPTATPTTASSLEQLALRLLASRGRVVRGGAGGGAEVERESNSAPASPRPARSQPASPAPRDRRRTRYSSASPIRQLLNSPLLNRRRNKKPSESSDDELSNGYNEVNSKNYRDLESFQKAQLRNKLKRGNSGVTASNNGAVAINNGSGSGGGSTASRRQLVMHNKAPMWNENSQVYQLDFGGRVTQESAKNFQIEYHGKQVMQFGRIDGNAYTLDFQYPFSALQAFAVALANVTQRLK
ncbi:Tubby-related protein 4 [Eumeta japonica]|uniref:Tubby-related protein 4 n=1 Tax=Eumeta variegata TaxID=151549 RepID=A0A4C1XHT7_EUMVA|nr:Tubby-related protein 4 [Eumeta japonica]